MRWPGVTAFFIGILAYLLARDGYSLIIPIGFGFRSIEWYIGSTLGSIGVLFGILCMFWHFANRHFWLYSLLASSGAFLSMFATVENQNAGMNGMFIMMGFAMFFGLAFVAALLMPSTKKKRKK